MAQDLTHEYAVDKREVFPPDVRKALLALTDDDLSKKSPVTGGGTEVGIEPGDTLTIRVEGHEGEWSRTSEDALENAVTGVQGVDELAESEGGYEQSE